jgi:hypothetical protein
VLYAARLGWNGFRVGYAARILVEQGEVHESSTLRNVVLPVLAGAELSWANPCLGVAGRWRRDAPPIERTLAQGPEGSIAWHCHMPRAHAQLTLDDRSLEGLGYVEYLRLTIPPWRLPFTRLRWGRHTSSAHSVVWIEWDGGAGSRWVWLDGVEQPHAALADHRVTGLAGGTELSFGPDTTVRDRRLLSTLAERLPALTRRLGGPLAVMHERKWLAPSTVTAPGTLPDAGWTLHEEVTW